MKTITLPIVLMGIILFAILFSYQLIVNRKCKALKGALLQNCKELFDAIGELRDLTGKMKKDENNVPSSYIAQLDDLAEKERIITVSLKNTIHEAL